VEAPPGDQEISLAFVTPLENLVGRVVSLLAWAAAAVLVWLGMRQERRA